MCREAFSAGGSMFLFRLYQSLFLLILSFTSLIAQSQHDILKKMIDSVSAVRLQTHIDKLQRAGGHWSRVNFTPGNDSAVKYVFNEFKKIPGLTSVSLDTFYIIGAQPPYDTRPLFNVVAKVEGKKNRNNVVVIGAHIDCSASRMDSALWYGQWNTMHVPGADDNASGVAGVLELARLLSDTTFAFSNDYTIVFVAFGAEEAGIVYPGYEIGSLHYASKAKEQGTNVVAMASLDMIGFNDLHNMYLNIAADEQSQWLGKHIVAMNDSFDLGILLNAPPFAYGRWSDHAPFWDQQFPAVCIIECSPPWNDNEYYRENVFYHTSSDTLGTLNMNLVKKAVQLTLASFATLTSPAVSVRNLNEVHPAEFALEQNFPNPFNPSTEIRFKIPLRSNGMLPESRNGTRVTLKVFDVLGREIATVVDDMKEPGTYSVRFDAASNPSGVYFYRMTGENISLSKKMLLLR